MTNPLTAQFSANADLNDFPELEITSSRDGTIVVIVPGQGRVAIMQVTAGKMQKVMVPDEALKNGVTAQLRDADGNLVDLISPDSSEYRARMRQFEEEKQSAANESLAA